MANSPFDQAWKCGTAITIASSTLVGTYAAIGTIPNVAVVMIFSNNTSNSVTISDDGINDFHTLIAGEHFVLDVRTNKGNANIAGFLAGTTWWAKGTAGTGTFEITYIYAR